MAWRATLNPSSGTLVALSTLACHAFEFKWHAIVAFLCWCATPSSSSGTPFDFSTFLASGKLNWRATPKVSGVPRLGLQVACQSDFLGLACDAFDAKWHAQFMLVFSCALPPSLDHCTSVPRHVAQVARPCICALFKFGVPCLGLQVARQSDFLELACHAFDTKWHTVVEVLFEVMSWRAMPGSSNGTPIVIDGSDMPRPSCVLLFALWNLLLACHAHMHAWIYLLEFSTGVPRLVPSVPRQCIFVAFALNWHASFTCPASCFSSTHF
ncbi:hypothetical protein AHAS_Ahas03G0229700 [Arachis hypogaea]